MNPRGFGFVAGGVGNDDVYVPPDAIGGALHGDRVLVSVVAQSDRGLEGRIEQVIKRRNPRVAGVLRRRVFHKEPVAEQEKHDKAEGQWQARV